MTSLNQILADLDAAKTRKDWERCVQLCREGMSLPMLPGTDEWYAFRLNLARFLVHSGREITSGATEEALEVYSQLVSQLPKDDLKRRAAASMGLGWVYYLRPRGEPRDNRIKSIEAFNDSLMYYTKQREPYTWASIKAAVGLVYSCTADEGDEFARHEALKNYEAALEVLTPADFPEDFREVSDKLNNLLSGRGQRG